MRVLVIEDDTATAAYVVDGLKTAGHAVEHVSDGRDGLILATINLYDVIVVDRVLPGLEGLAIVKTIRGAGVKAPVLFLTARAGIDDRVEGLEAGGDDYLTKPFAFSELMARLNALATRACCESATFRWILLRDRLRTEIRMPLCSPGNFSCSNI